MVTLWIGDFRTKQIQNVYSAAQQTAEYHYITDDLAEYSWFKDNAATQLPLLSLDRANVVIMLGFNDCLYSCVWDTFKADKIAEKYIEIINELTTDFSSLNFYVCAVNPVNGDYQFFEQTEKVPLTPGSMPLSPPPLSSDPAAVFSHPDGCYMATGPDYSCA